MPKAYISPFTNNTNAYIELHKQTLKDVGYDVKPLNFKALFSVELLDVLSSSNLLVFHWLETRVFQWSKGKSKVSIIGLFQVLIYMVVIFLSRAKTIYVVHDHSVHDTLGCNKKLSVFFIRTIARISKLRVVHDPSYEDIYKAHYIPHPLYWEQDILSADSRITNAPTNQAILFGIVGAIRPYKSIDEVLSVWPQNARLLIRGKALESYRALLQSIMMNRSLNNVELTTGFMSKQELDSVINNLDVLIIPHLSESMLVSGSFFEAIGRVKFIVARTSPFLRWAAKEFDGIYLFNHAQELCEIVERLSKTSNNVDMEKNRYKAINMFGSKACRLAYSKLCGFQEAHS